MVCALLVHRLYLIVGQHCELSGARPTRELVDGAKKCDSWRKSNVVYLNLSNTKRVCGCLVHAACRWAKEALPPPRRRACSHMRQHAQTCMQHWRYRQRLRVPSRNFAEVSDARGRQCESYPRGLWRVRQERMRMWKVTKTTKSEVTRRIWRPSGLWTVTRRICKRVAV